MRQTAKKVYNIVKQGKYHIDVQHDTATCVVCSLALTEVYAYLRELSMRDIYNFVEKFTRESGYCNARFTLQQIIDIELLRQREKPNRKQVSVARVDVWGAALIFTLAHD